MVQAWGATVEGSPEDGVLSLDEEAALVRYLKHFGLSDHDMDSNGAYRNMVKSAGIRELADGIVPRPTGLFRHSSLQSEVAGNAGPAVRRSAAFREQDHERAPRHFSWRQHPCRKGSLLPFGHFRSWLHEWEDKVHVDTGRLGISTWHIYFPGPRKRYRVRLNEIASFEPYSDGTSAVRDAR